MDRNLVSSEPKVVKSDSTAEIKLSLFTAAVSATLRMIVPTIGLFLIGLTIDFVLRQTALYAIIGAVIGFLVAGLLIYRQVKHLKIKGHDLLINDPTGAIKTTKGPKEK